MDHLEDLIINYRMINVSMVLSLSLDRVDLLKPLASAFFKH